MAIGEAQLTLSGINMLVYFSTQIFSNLGYSPMLSGILAGVMNTIFAIASYPPIWFIEKLGRRAMMFWCALGCGVCMLIYVGLTTVANPTTATRARMSSAASTR